jgi:hypothetical protein
LLRGVVREPLVAIVEKVSGKPTEEGVADDAGGDGRAATACRGRVSPPTVAPPSPATAVLVPGVPWAVSHPASTQAISATTAVAFKAFRHQSLPCSIAIPPFGSRGSGVAPTYLRRQRRLAREAAASGARGLCAGVQARGRQDCAASPAVRRRHFDCGAVQHARSVRRLENERTGR